MIGRKRLTPEHAAWNAAWQPRFPVPGARRFLRVPWLARRTVSPFAFQPNSSMREFEYPWAYDQVAPHPGQVVVDLGGALSGFQFTLAAAGASVINVDPFFDYGGSLSYAEYVPTPHTMLSKMNRAWPGDVRLSRTTLPDANLEPESVDVVVSVSTLEHFPPDDIAATLDSAVLALKPGGRLVLTVDLFLDLAPFTDRTKNQWGTNIDLRALCERTGLPLVVGEPHELCGFYEFSPRKVQANLDELFVGSYPAVPQALVLQKP